MMQEHIGAALDRRRLKKQPPSRIRKIYTARLVGRVLIFIAAVLLIIAAPEQFDILNGMNFFKEFSLLHLLWIVWLFDMLWQVIPAKNEISLGSQKHFPAKFRPIAEKINPEALKRYIVSTTKAAYRVLILWVLLTAAIGVLHFCGIIDKAGLLLVTIFFYVCDLICVLIWCPFRLMMKTRCCTTCRIFNWDHLMMFSPMIFVKSFYSLSLFIMSLIVWLVWEFCVLMHPERFWEKTNDALRCTSCTDKLCTQYCQKLR